MGVIGISDSTAIKAQFKIELPTPNDLREREKLQMTKIITIIIIQLSVFIAGHKPPPFLSVSSCLELLVSNNTIFYLGICRGILLFKLSNALRE